MIALIATLLTVFWLASHYRRNKIYKKGSYYQITKNPYSSVRYDKGKHGEYLTYKCLRHFENTGGKFLFNALIPREQNKTTEIDVLLICPKGLFVIECKNYSGWIFGSETSKNWVQIFPRGRGHSHKEYFYNPIIQNASHIKYLKNLIGKDIPVQSIIVFSDRCVLKDIRITSDQTTVTNHYSIASVIAGICDETQTTYTETEINDIYQNLYPYTQLDHAAKEKHKQEVLAYVK